MILTAAVFVLMFLASVTAVGVARRMPEYRPVAAVLVVILAANIIRQIIEPYIITSPGDPPLTGTARVLGHIEQALYLLDPFAIAAGSIALFLERRPWPLIPFWAALVAALVLTYPLSRGAVLRQVYLDVELAALVVSVGALLTWARRWERVEQHRRAMALIIAADAVIVVLGPWRYSLGVRWDLALTGELMLFGLLTFLQGRCLWSSRSS
jgi:hypothetical protein